MILSRQPEKALTTVFWRWAATKTPSPGGELPRLPEGGKKSREEIRFDEDTVSSHSLEELKAALQKHILSLLRWGAFPWKRGMISFWTLLPGIIRKP